MTFANDCSVEFVQKKFGQQTKWMIFSGGFTPLLVGNSLFPQIRHFGKNFNLIFKIIKSQWDKRPKLNIHFRVVLTRTGKSTPLVLKWWVYISIQVFLPSHLSKLPALTHSLTHSLTTHSPLTHSFVDSYNIGNNIENFETFMAIISNSKQRRWDDEFRVNILRFLE